MNENTDCDRGNAVRPQNMRGDGRESILSAHSIELGELETGRSI